MYTQDLDFETIRCTVLEIIMGDFALFCMETSPDGADALAADSFDLYAHQTIKIIKGLLPLYELDYGSECRRLRMFLREELEKYWNA